MAVMTTRFVSAAELMARVQDGDRDSCRVLLEDIGPMLTNFLRRGIVMNSKTGTRKL